MRLISIAIAFAALAVPPIAATAGGPPVYEKDVLPLLTARCGGCHAAGGSAGFDIRTAGTVLQGGKSGSAVTAGNPEASLLYKMVSTGKMPPTPPRLTSAELQKISGWIRGGAHSFGSTQGHWAFTPPTASAPPAIANVRNPIDKFLLASLYKAGLSFSAEADRRTLIRRVTIDLIGVPPTPEEVAAFAGDRRPDAYNRLVDRLLTDNRYGERWATAWLDTAGYADSEGVLEEDRLRPNAWHYRDYVIRALNEDKPYDQFLKEQIAGDELSNYRTAQKWTPDIEDAVTATGFLRTAVDATRDDFVTHQYVEYQFRTLNDTQTILVSTTLGITLQCARCHDHKYEPFTQRDYYSMQAILAGAIRPNGALLTTSRRQITAATVKDQEAAKAANAAIDTGAAAMDADLAKLSARYRKQYFETKSYTVPAQDRAGVIAAYPVPADKQTAEQKALVVKYKSICDPPDAVVRAEFADYSKAADALATKKADLLRGKKSYAEIRALYDQDAAVPAWHVNIRGEYTRPGDIVQPEVPRILDDPKHPFSIPTAAAGAPSTGRRLALANWIARPDNPLTARVAVNRIWARHFGVGIVPTVENFGKSGAAPSNQQLLDWLSVNFARGIGGGKPWSQKALHRLIVTSAAYRQSSATRPIAAKRDPDDRLLWRQRTHRMEAEAIRDSILFAAGSLDGKMYGEPVNEQVLATGEVVAQDDDKTARRSIYLLVRRSRPVSVLNTFDSPIIETNCTRRIVSTTPAQALTVLNGTFMAAQSRAMAVRIEKERGSKLADCISRAFQLGLQREPSPAEMLNSDAFLATQTTRYVRSGNMKSTAQHLALSDLCLALLGSDESIYVD